MPWSPPPVRWPCRLPRAGSPRARSLRPTLSPRTPNTRRHKGEDMALSDFLNRKRPPLDGGTGEGVSPLSGDLAGNEAVRRKQRLLLAGRSEEHTSELQSLMRSSYAVFCLKKK